jgi:ribosomal protein S18 acetylase RimI-like enzyme
MPESPKSVIEVSERRDSPQFRAAAGQALIACGFPPQDVEAFLAAVAAGNAGTLHVARVPSGIAYMGTPGRPLGTVRFIIPQPWARRHQIIEQAIRLIQQSRTTGGLTIQVDEACPSLGAYLLGMLPGLGFELECRAQFTIEGSRLTRGVAADADDGCRTIALAPPLRSRFAAVYADGFAEYQDCWPPAATRRDAAYWDDELTPPPGCDLAGLGIEHAGRLVACCDYRIEQTTLMIRNLAVLPQCRRQGLGTRLLVQCVNRARLSLGDSDPSITLNTNRAWQPAMAFYHGRGFQIRRLFTHAWWEPASP